jgi:hypothetical protein
MELPEVQAAPVELPVDGEDEEDLPKEEAALERLPMDEENLNPLIQTRRPRGWLQAGLAMVAMLPLARQERLVTGFVAYDCANATNRVDAYFLLEPAACHTTEDHYEVERTIYDEIIQMKRDRIVPVYRCTVIESVMSQYCGFNSAGHMVQYLMFRERRKVEAQECRAAEDKWNMVVGGQEF